MTEPADSLDLWDYRRRVDEIYRDVRAGGPGAETHDRWRRARDALFRAHPSSPIPTSRRADWNGLSYFRYDPTWRIATVVEAVEPLRLGAGHSGSGETPLIRFGRARGVMGGTDIVVSLFRLDTYGGGVFVPFRDAGNGHDTYGGGRYLLDTAKGADLGHDGETVILDFNYAYHPSCVHDPRWSCPLAPPENTVAVAISAGERLPG